MYIPVYTENAIFWIDNVFFCKNVPKQAVSLKFQQELKQLRKFFIVYSKLGEENKNKFLETTALDFY